MQAKILLDEDEIPTHWYNVVADMPNAPAPVLGIAISEAVEEAASRRDTNYAYDYGDSAGLTPLMLQYTLGHDFVPRVYMPAVCVIMVISCWCRSCTRKACWRRSRYRNWPPSRPA